MNNSLGKDATYVADRTRKHMEQCKLGSSFHMCKFHPCQQASAKVNAFAVGLPAVFWHQQGFLDLVAGTDYPAIATSAPLRIPDIPDMAVSENRVPPIIAI